MCEAVELGILFFDKMKRTEVESYVCCPETTLREGYYIFDCPAQASACEGRSFIGIGHLRRGRAGTRTISYFVICSIPLIIV
jgi:hypothetical protein